MVKRFHFLMAKRLNHRGREPWPKSARTWRHVKVVRSSGNCDDHWAAPWYVFFWSSTILFMGDFIVNCSGWFSGWFYFMMRWFWNCLVFLCSLTGSLWKGLLVLGPFFREWSSLWAEQRPVPGGNPDYKGQSSQAGATQLGDILLGEGPGTLASHHITSCQIYNIIYYLILFYIKLNHIILASGW